MSQQNYRGNLSSATFPLVSSQQARTVIIPRIDQNFVPQIASSQDADKDRGIPQVYYMQNVLPTEYGYQSISYDLVMTPPEAQNLRGCRVHSIWPAGEDHTGAFYFTFRHLSGHSYTCDNIEDNWSDRGDVGPGGYETVAAVQGKYYMQITKSTVYELESNGDLSGVNYTGISEADVVGIESSNGYLIAWTEEGIFWSSLTNPLDFVPSLITGAGGGQLEEAKGSIILCAKNATGFMIYCAGNIVSATYSNNSRYPFIFREIPGSAALVQYGDLRDYQRALAVDNAAGVHYAFSSSGLQSISPRGIEPIYPAVTDFIKSGFLEDFDIETGEFSSSVQPFLIQVALISGRFLVISYGEFPDSEVGEEQDPFAYALIIDMQLKRIGKLKVRHEHIFELNIGSLNERNKVGSASQIGILTFTGDTYMVDNAYREVYGDYPEGFSTPAIVFGKFQLDRNYMLQIQKVEFENVDQSNYSCLDLYTLDGKTVSVVEGDRTTSTGLLASFTFGALVGLNHSFGCTGQFHLNSILLTFNNAGRVY